MKFEEAINAMKEGKRVRRKSWVDKFPWVKQGDMLKCVVGLPILIFDNFEATDWEIVEYKKTLSDNRIHTNAIPGVDHFSYKERMVKQFINKIKQRISNETGDECSAKIARDYSLIIINQEAGERLIE